jgi:hypothetical protein
MHRGYTCLWRKIWSDPLFIEPCKPFSRLEAWLYITNMLAAQVDDEAAGLKCGEFVASIRQLADRFHWSIGATHRFLETLLQNAMIARVGHQVEHLAEQQAGHFSVCNYETYNLPRYTAWNTRRNTEPQGVCINNSNIYNNKDTPAFAKASAGMVLADRSSGEGRSPKILLEIYQQHNYALPGVRALTADRLRKCRSRINQAVHDRCLEQYLADFVEAVKKAHETPFLRGEGGRGWRANFDWFVANHRNVYAVLEGKYDGPAMSPNHRDGASHGNDHGHIDGDGSRPAGVTGRTSRGDPIYIPRQ